MAQKYDVKEAFVPLPSEAPRDGSRRIAPPKQFEGQRLCYSTPRDLSFRCSAERSMPMNSAVRDMFPPNRLI
jgi:hypothetical protein